MRYLIPFLSIALLGCPALQTRNEIKTADGRFETASTGASSSSRPSSNTAAPATRAEQAADYHGLLEEVRRLNGQVEELQYRLQQAEQGQDKESLQARVENLEKRLIAFSETLLLFEQQMAQKGVNVQAPATASSSASARNSDPFDKGEALFKKSEWKNAILEYNRYRDNFPKGKNYAEATYKIGVCFQELNMKEEARAFYSEVIEKFPKSKSARSAKYRLNQLKK